MNFKLKSKIEIFPELKRTDVTLKVGKNMEPNLQNFTITKGHHHLPLDSPDADPLIYFFKI